VTSLSDVVAERVVRWFNFRAVVRSRISNLLYALASCTSILALLAESQIFRRFLFFGGWVLCLQNLKC
jgi:hypothetical protein